MVCAYNEERGLQSMLPRIPPTVLGHDVEVIVLDDGSTDATAEVARQQGCTIVIGDTNQGKGSMMRQGLQFVGGRHFAAIVFMDGDGQHRPEDLSKLIAPILDRSADVVIGSRYLWSTGRESTPRNRYVVRSATVAVLDRILSLTITDPYSGYRALSPAASRCVEFVGDRYESELEMLFCAARSQMRVAEVPIARIYGPSTSKMGSRHGALVGRVVVVGRYAMTIVRESLVTRRRGTERAERAEAA